MFHPRNISTVLRDPGGWLAAALLATTAVLVYANLVWAQQTSTEATVPAPSLTAEADNGTVELNWTAVADAARYELLTWWNADTGWQKLDDGNLTDTTYSHTGLTAGTTYFYTVRTVNAAGETSPWSEYASATATTVEAQTQTPTPTAMPMISTTPTPTPSATAAAAQSAPVLAAQVTAAGTIDLSWGVVADAARYELLTWWNADTGWQKLDDGNLTDTTYSHTGLAAGTTYFYTVRAVNATGETGPWSEYASATATTGQTPTPTAMPMISTTPTPTAVPMISTTPTPTPSATAAAALSAPVLAAQVTAAGTIDLSWGVVADAARYELLTWWNAGTGWQKLDDGNLTDTTYSHTGLAAGTTYFYTVRAVNAAGETGLWSEYASATVTTGQTPTQTPTPTAMPMISTTPTPTAVPMISTTPTPTPSATAAAALSAPVLAAQVTAAGTIDLSWGVVADAARYELLTWWNADTGWQKLDDGNLTDTTYSHTGLTAGTTYFYTVRAVNAAGETGLWSEYASATVTAGQTPTQTPTPTAFSANTDRVALVALYNATDGANWFKSDNWLTEAPLYDWHGVETDSTGRVVSLNLEDNQLRGTIPPELGRLSNLTELRLYDNWLSGTIPTELGKLTNLEVLSLDINQLSGTIPTELGNLSYLEELWLGGNQLSGTIPTELGNLSYLTALLLNLNQLSGTIPPELGNLSNLTLLLLNHNQLSGMIPPELGNLSNLEVLGLAANQLSGSIPTELGNLSNLTDLWLENNQLSGSIPPELGRLSNLTWLNLGTNQLSGAIPPELGRLSNLTELRLHDNQLTGAIPPELGNLSNLTDLYLGGNGLTGCIPSGLRNVDRNDLAGLGLPDCG